jgi:hypothetical protein
MHVQTIAETDPAAVRSAIEAVANSDEDRWAEARRVADDHGLRLISIDAVEGLAVAAADRRNFADCLELLATAAGLREDIGYRWRFRAEQERVDVARTRAVVELGEQAE